MSPDPKIVWEQRWHPLREEWVLFTSHRGGRPWIGEMHSPRDAEPPAYDPTCASAPATSESGVRTRRTPGPTGSPMTCRASRGIAEAAAQL